MSFTRTVGTLVATVLALRLIDSLTRGALDRVAETLATMPLGTTRPAPAAGTAPGADAAPGAQAAGATKA